MKTTSTIAAALAMASLAPAALINVNFNGFTGNPDSGQVESTLEGPAGGLGTTWNQFADEDSAGPLNDSTGTATSVEFTTNFTEGRFNGASPGTLNVLEAALTDFGRGATRNLTITGLQTGSLYDIWLIGYRESGSATERLYGNWETTNPTTSATNQFVDNRVGNNGSTFVAGYNYVLFENVEAVAGQIVFDGKGQTTADGADDNYRHGLNGFQINSIPEPSSLSLLGLAGLLILRRRK